MPRCPKCNYLLVLHPNSRRYRCSKCRKSFPQKEIDLKEFHEYNNSEKQREKVEADKIKEEADKQNRREYNKLHKGEKKEYFKKYYQEHKEKLKAKQKEWSKNNPDKVKGYKKKSKEAQAKYREENREEYNAMKQEYWANNKEHLNEKRKENYEAHKDQILGQQAAYRQNNKILRSINHLRTQQKELALRMIENGTINPYNAEFKSILPTF